MIGTLSLTGAGQLFASANTAESEKVQTAVETQLEKPQDFAGMVAETEQGFVLKTVAGTFLLEGMDVTGLVNKEVVVTGVLKNGDKNSAIFVMKAEVKG